MNLMSKQTRMCVVFGFISVTALQMCLPSLADTRILDPNVPMPNPGMEIAKLIFERNKIPFNIESAKAALVHKDPWVRTVGLTGVRHLGTLNDIPLIKPLLRDMDRFVQEKAIEVLHSWSWELPPNEREALNKEILSVAQAICTEKNLSHRALGEAKFLARLGDTSRYPVVLDALKDKTLRSSALFSVKEIFLSEKAYNKDKAGFDWISPLVSCLRGLSPGEKEWETGITTLQVIGTPEAVAAIRLLAETTQDETLKQSLLKKARVLEWTIEREKNH